MRLSAFYRKFACKKYGKNMIEDFSFYDFSFKFCAYTSVSEYVISSLAFIWVALFMAEIIRKLKDLIRKILYLLYTSKSDRAC